MSEESQNEKQQSEQNTMQTTSETVGLVPNLNKNDNLIQLVVVGAGTLLTTIGAVVITGRLEKAAVGAVIGLIFFGLLSGGILMFMGWYRNFLKEK